MCLFHEASFLKASRAHKYNSYMELNCLQLD